MAVTTNIDVHQVVTLRRGVWVLPDGSSVVQFIADFRVSRTSSGALTIIPFRVYGVETVRPRGDGAWSSWAVSHRGYFQWSDLPESVKGITDREYLKAREVLGGTPLPVTVREETGS